MRGDYTDRTIQEFVVVDYKSGIRQSHEMTPPECKVPSLPRRTSVTAVGLTVYHHLIHRKEINGSRLLMG